jgi:hypothetical protein
LIYYARQRQIKWCPTTQQQNVEHTLVFKVSVNSKEIKQIVPSMIQAVDGVTRQLLD